MVFEKRGFTLIELVLVITLIGLMLSIGLPSLRNALFTDELNSSTRKIMGLVKGLRHRAIREGRSFNLYFDIESGRFWIKSLSGKEDEREGVDVLQMPPDLSILDVWSGHQGKVARGQGAIHFTKRGYVQHTVIHLESSDGKELSLEISPFMRKTKIYKDYLDIGGQM